MKHFDLTAFANQGLGLLLWLYGGDKASSVHIQKVIKLRTQRESSDCHDFMVVFFEMSIVVLGALGNNDEFVSTVFSLIGN
jgi:hypothetical protein